MRNVLCADVCETEHMVLLPTTWTASATQRHSVRTTYEYLMKLHAHVRIPLGPINFLFCSLVGLQGQPSCPSVCFPRQHYAFSRERAHYFMEAIQIELAKQ